MGKVLQLRRACDEDLAKLPSGGTAAGHFVDPDPEDPARCDGSVLVIDKSWHVIHFLLADEPWCVELPHGFLLGGKPAGDDVAYGPVRLLSPAEVALVDHYLKSFPENFITSKFDFDKLQAAEIYPLNWHRRDPADVDCAALCFSRLRAFVAEAAAQGQGIALVILVSWTGTNKRLLDVPPEVATADALELCSIAGIRIFQLESAGWVWPMGLNILESALSEDEREMFVDQDIVMGILHTDRKVMYSFSSMKGAVLVSDGTPRAVLASYRKT